MSSPTVQKADLQPDRRRAERTALRLSATMREGTRSRTKVKIIDMSTHGCRMECSSTVSEDSWVYLSIAGLETQYCRVVWNCQEFVGVEFAKPLAQPVFDRLLQDHNQLPETAIKELRAIANRTNRLARLAGDSDIPILAELSRKCAVDAMVEGLRLGQNPKKR
jgi:hypothetical protein